MIRFDETFPLSDGISSLWGGGDAGGGGQVPPLPSALMLLRRVRQFAIFRPWIMDFWTNGGSESKTHSYTSVSCIISSIFSNKKCLLGEIYFLPNGATWFDWLCSDFVVFGKGGWLGGCSSSDSSVDFSPGIRGATFYFFICRRSRFALGPEWEETVGLCSFWGPD